MCAHLAISAASEATGAMSGVCAVAVGALAGLIGLKVSFAAPPRAPKKRQPRNGVTERERPRCFCEPLGAEPMSIRSRLPRASVAKGPPGISFHSSEAPDHLNCTRVSTGHWCGTGLKKAHLTVRVSLARLFSVGVDGKCGDGRQRACLMAARGKIGRSERPLGENEWAVHRSERH